MSYRRDLRRLRRARRQAKRQLRQLADLELAGLTAVTLHAHGQQLTITLASPTGHPSRMRCGSCCTPAAVPCRTKPAR